MGHRSKLAGRVAHSTAMPGGDEKLPVPWSSTKRLRKPRRPGDQGDVMGNVVMHNVVSVDGFIADENDQVGPLFDWYGNGEHTLAVDREGTAGALRVSKA